jgi:hypothetical protein
MFSDPHHVGNNVILLTKRIPLDLFRYGRTRVFSTIGEAEQKMVESINLQQRSPYKRAKTLKEYPRTAGRRLSDAIISSEPPP